ncbi:MAG TPA: hypothetical protein PKH10_12220, partial [bacterium]|nr:hypothetical protein [bacterium]
ATFLDAMPSEWDAFFNLRMIGLINDPNTMSLDAAFLVDLGATLKGATYDLGDTQGYYLRDAVETNGGSSVQTVIATGLGNLTWPVSGQLASLWVGQLYAAVDDLMDYKSQAANEGVGGVTVEGSFKMTVFEIWIEIIGSSQVTRMECVRGISAMNGDGTAYEGSRFVCVDNNTEWAIGETMKMMDYAQMLDQDADILAVLNEGLAENDPDYRADVCQCWEQDGTTLMNCDDMRIEFGL